jgi:hypothetical protein
MIDSVRKKPIRIEMGGNAPADFSLPFQQLDQVRALFDANNIKYWVDEEVLSIDDGPEIAFVTISRNSDPELAQQLLDGVP